ncbi:MAG TPA: ribonuclease J, partial [Haloplasmataceae bacterium]
IGDIGNVVIRDRKILANDGLLAVVVNVDLKNKAVLQKPKVVSRGFIYMKDSQELIREIQDSVEAYLNDLMQQPRKSIVQMKNELTDYLTSLVYDNTQRRPMIIPVIMNVKRSS